MSDKGFIKGLAGLHAMACGPPENDEVDALRAEVERLKAQDDVHWKTRRALLADVSARDRVIEAAFEALNAWSGIVSYTSCGHLTAVARRLRAELEGK